MIYKKFQDLQLSMLGMGAMRLPVKDGKNGVIDEEATAKMVARAMESGINYYDTAWGYHSGQSEPVMGKVLGKYPRDSYYLATKFPGYDLSNMGKVEEIFEAQLKKCGVTYFDFYLFHNVNSKNIDAYLDQKYGIYAYLLKQKQNGRIRHLGFSAHGDCSVMRRFLEAYKEGMEFCQIQLNYLDWTLQDAMQKVELLREYQLPIWVMEPLRGGRLVTLQEESREILKGLRPKEGIPAWAFRFLQSLEGVTMILSGMSNEEQLVDNLHTFETDSPLNKTEMEALLGIAGKMLEKKTLFCTSCRYCVDHCPKQLDIPALLDIYNSHYFTKREELHDAVSKMSEEKKPGACVGCRSCEAVCPQQIKISEAMANFGELLQH